MRIILTILMVITLDGCISADYKSGSYWVLEEQSQEPTNMVTKECTSNKARTDGATASSSQIIAPYFIPLFYLSKNPDKQIIVTMENRKCPQLSIKGDDNDVLTYTTSSPDSEHCKIYIAQPKHANKIIIRTLHSENGCKTQTDTLVKKSFFCVRQTEFGGSPACEKPL